MFTKNFLNLKTKDFSSKENIYVNPFSFNILILFSKFKLLFSLLINCDKSILLIKISDKSIFKTFYIFQNSFFYQS